MTSSLSVVGGSVIVPNEGAWSLMTGGEEQEWAIEGGVEREAAREREGGGVLWWGAALRGLVEDG